MESLDIVTMSLLQSQYSITTAGPKENTGFQIWISNVQIGFGTQWFTTHFQRHHRAVVLNPSSMLESLGEHFKHTGLTSHPDPGKSDSPEVGPGFPC